MMDYVFSMARELVVKLLKADLHVHLEGTVDPSTLLELAEKNNIQLDAPVVLPERTVRPPPKLNKEFGCINNFMDFIGLYLKISESIQTPEDLLLVAKRYLESARKQNITASQLYFTPSTFEAFGRNMGAMYDALIEAQVLAKQSYGVSISWIFDIVRNISRDGEETLEFALSAREQGVDVKGLGLSGYEAEGPALAFSEVFKRARGLGFKTLAHAGETAGIESIKETLRCLRPSRIGHGLFVLDDESVSNSLIEQNIAIEVCPWSNISLGLTTKEKHPLCKMTEAGLPVVISADDPGIFQKTLVDNYMLAHEMGVNIERLDEIAKRSLLFL